MAEIQLIDSAILKKTQELLGQLINKSVLTDKLLSKPPFRFLHDVITSVKTSDTRLFKFLLSSFLVLLYHCIRIFLICLTVAFNSFYKVTRPEDACFFSDWSVQHNDI